MTTIANEFKRLESVYRRLGARLNRQPPATQFQLDQIETTTEIKIAEGIQELWRMSNGSGRTMWFAEGEGEFTPYYFLSVEDALDNWSLFSPYDAGHYAQWHDDESWGKRDRRIQRHFLRHKSWFSFAEFNGGSHLLHFDADPTPQGSFGQIINFVHDPDGVFWTAESFLEFFTTSNNTLESWLKYPKQLREQLWIHERPWWRFW